MLRAAPAARWRWVRLWDAPHRLAFACAAGILALTALWWAAVNLLEAGGAGLRWGIPRATSHALLMSFGFMPAFFAGFLFTGGPRWLERAPVHARSLTAPLLAHVAGWLVFGIAVHGRDPAASATLGALGVAAAALAWTALLWRFGALVRASRAADRSHPWVIAGAGAVGAACLWVVAGALLVRRLDVVHAATRVGLWGFIGTTFAAAMHRMVPFFTAAAWPRLDAWRPRWLLWLLVAVLAGEAVDALLTALPAALPAALRWLQAGLEGATGLLLGGLAIRWARLQSLRMRLIAMLHAGLVWLALAFVLQAGSHALVATPAAAGLLGLAALHAFTMGFLGSIMLAMVSRVSSGHGGRTVAADDFVWRLFWILQLAALLRVAGALLGAWGREPAASMLVAAAGVGWAAAAVPWASRYAHWYGTPRPDGRPG